MGTKEKVLSYLKENGEITEDQIMDYGVKDHSSVISRLRGRGYNIESARIDHRPRKKFGHTPAKTKLKYKLVE